MWTGSTRSLLPTLKPGQCAEVPLQVRLRHQYGIKCLCGHGPACAEAVKLHRAWLPKQDEASVHCKRIKDYPGEMSDFSIC
jgi:hypothetical protein